MVTPAGRWFREAFYRCLEVAPRGSDLLLKPCVRVSQIVFEKAKHVASEKMRVAADVIDRSVWL